jgi:CheY-like chemotaxis protein
MLRDRESEMLDILLVDDEPDFRMLIGDALRDAGHRVTLASNGA